MRMRDHFYVRRRILRVWQYMNLGDENIPGSRPYCAIIDLHFADVSFPTLSLFPQRR